jgi:hypothetical protein
MMRALTQTFPGKLRDLVASFRSVSRSTQVLVIVSLIMCVLVWGSVVKSMFSDEHIMTLRELTSEVVQLRHELDAVKGELSALKRTSER